MKTMFVMLLATITPFFIIAQPVITGQPTNQVVPYGGTVIFNTSVSGAGPFTYQWLFNGSNLPGTFPGGMISTAAGNGTQGFSGDGNAATNAKLSFPGGLVVDANGNLLIADQYNHRIRRADTNGVIATVAGNGTQGDSGDGGAATNASLNIPTTVAVDAAGNLFFAEAGGNRVRKVDTNGIITTFAGNGIATYSGDGNLATNASLNFSWGVALDVHGNLFIGDQFNNRVRRVDTNGIITTVAGNGSSSSYGDGGAATNAGVIGPCGLAFDRTGNLYIVQHGAGLVRCVGTNGIITTVAGGGTGGGIDGLGDGRPATNAILNGPYTLAFDAAGNLLISDQGNNRVRQVDANGIITSVVGNGTGSFSGDGGAATNASLNGPLGLALDGYGNLFISDYSNQRVRKVAPGQGPILTIPNIGLGNVGGYQVIISSASGSVTSSIATLTIPPLPATAAALVATGALAGFTLTSGGFGYTNTPLVYIVGGGGSGAQAVAVVSNGMVTALNIISNGSGYTNPPQVIIDPPFISSPVLSITPMSVLSFSNLAVGGSYQLQMSMAWYWTNLPVSFTATNAVYAQMLAGVAGPGLYRLALNPTPTQAFATAQVVNGFVVGATVTSGGSGYVTNPPVQIVGGGGANATAGSQISGGVLTQINITSAGIGYTNLPAIRIGQPPADAVSPVVLPVMRVDSAGLAAYHNYQIQFTPDFSSIWTDWSGGFFAPTDVTNSQFLFITNDTGFFRLQYVP